MGENESGYKHERDKTECVTRAIMNIILGIDSCEGNDPTKEAKDKINNLLKEFTNNWEYGEKNTREDYLKLLENLTRELDEFQKDFKNKDKDDEGNFIESLINYVRRQFINIAKLTFDVKIIKNMAIGGESGEPAERGIEELCATIDKIIDDNSSNPDHDGLVYNQIYTLIINYLRDNEDTKNKKTISPEEKEIESYKKTRKVIIYLEGLLAQYLNSNETGVNALRDSLKNLARNNPKPDNYKK